MASASLPAVRTCGADIAQARRHGFARERIVVDDQDAHAAQRRRRLPRARRVDARSRQRRTCRMKRAPSPGAERSSSGMSEQLARCRLTMARPRPKSFAAARLRGARTPRRCAPDLPPRCRGRRRRRRSRRDRRPRVALDARLAAAVLQRVRHEIAQHRARSERGPYGAERRPCGASTLAVRVFGDDAVEHLAAAEHRRFPDRPRRPGCAPDRAAWRTCATMDLVARSILARMSRASAILDAPIERAQIKRQRVQGLAHVVAGDGEEARLRQVGRRAPARALLPLPRWRAAIARRSRRSARMASADVISENSASAPASELSARVRLPRAARLTSARRMIASMQRLVVELRIACVISVSASRSRATRPDVLRSPASSAVERALGQHLRCGRHRRGCPRCAALRWRSRASDGQRLGCLAAPKAARPRGRREQVRALRGGGVGFARWRMRSPRCARCGFRGARSFGFAADAELSPAAPTR